MVELIGRERECAQIDALLADARRGHSGVLVVRGEAGIGKTALLSYGREQAVDLQLAALTGVESEMTMGYSGIHQLLAPHLRHLPAIPGPQAEAVQLAFGLRSGPRPDPFVVALGTLSLLAQVASGKPLICLVDDAQWVDDESTRTIAAVARRLDAEGIAVLIAARQPPERLVPYDMFPQLELSGLGRGPSRDLLRRDRGGGLPVHLLDRLVDSTRGNPLGLLTFAGAFDTERDEVLGAGEPLPLPSRLEARYQELSRSFPPATQALLLAAAADPTGDQDLLRRAGVELGYEIADADIGVLRDFFDIGPPVRFHHPLMRSAIYHGASTAERRRTHAALAAGTHGIDAQDRRAWHRAAAVEDHDEIVAAELRAAAERARNRGASAAVAAFLVRSARITPEGPLRGERLVVAAEAAWLAGIEGSALRLVREATPRLVDPRLRTRARRVEASVLAGRTTGLHAWIKLVADARSIEAPDVTYARTTLLEAIAANTGQDRAVLAELSKLVLDLALPPGQPATSVDLLLDGLCCFFSVDEQVAEPMLRAALERPDLIGSNPVDHRSVLVCSCAAAAAIGDHAALRAHAGRLAAFGRQHGAPVAVYQGLVSEASAELATGAVGQALEILRFEGEAIRDVIAPEMLLGDVMAAAWRGEEEEARGLEVAQAAWMAAHDLAGYQHHVDYAIAVLEVGLGNYAAALEPARRALPAAYQLKDLILVELIEAAVRCGEAAEAGEAAEQLAGRAAHGPGNVNAGLLARSRALLAGDDAEAHYREALKLLDTGSPNAHVARAALVYGEWLRRQRRRSEARKQLGDAVDMLEALGAEGFAERARRELQAAGERRHRRDSASDELTPQEHRIAELAAGGATNVQIAAKLFLSPATVDYHLGKVYRKLQITSRRDLPRVLS